MSEVGEIENQGEPKASSLELGLGAKLSALLLVSPRPVSVHVLADATRVDAMEVEQELLRLKDKFDPAEFGFNLQEVADGWQLRTSPLASTVIARLAPPKAKRLSKAASETLAVVAYKQPVGKAEIDSIRGVDSTPTLRGLLDLRLVRAVGRSNSPGHPVLYGTTSLFLERFGLRDLADLPTVRELSELDKAAESHADIKQEGGGDDLFDIEIDGSVPSNDNRTLVEQIEITVVKP